MSNFEAKDSFEAIMKNIGKTLLPLHRHHVAFTKECDILWLCGCKRVDFLPGERETLEKIFIQEVLKQERANS